MVGVLNKHQDGEFELDAVRHWQQVQLHKCPTNMVMCRLARDEIVQTSSKAFYTAANVSFSQATKFGSKSN